MTDYEELEPVFIGLPDRDDAHVIAAAAKTRASVSVTENLKHFPPAVLRPLDLAAKSADEFAADSIDLNHRHAAAAIRKMRERLQRPEKTPERLLLDMEADGLVQTADLLQAFVRSL